MQPGIKKVVVILTIVLVVVVGLVIVSSLSDKSTGEPVAVATTQPEVTEAPQQAEPAQGEQEAQSDEAQGTVYEGALAGLTEEEIGQLAMAEEQSSARQDDSGAEGAVD